MPMGQGGIAGAVDFGRQQDLLGQQQLNQGLLQGASQAAANRRLLEQEEFQRQQQLQKQQVDQQQWEQRYGPGGMYQQREWQSPTTALGYQRLGDTEQQRQAIADFYQKASKLPPDAPIGEYLKLMNPGVPPSAFSTIIQMRKPSPSDQFLDSPVGTLTKPNINFFSAAGEAPTDPSMTVRQLYGAGYVMLNDKDAESMRQSKLARENLNGILEAGNRILPEKPSLSAATVAPLMRWTRTKEGYADYQDYQHAMAGIIPYMISLTRVGRVNQTELNLVVDALRNANTKEGLKAAVERAQKIIDNEQATLAKIGRMNPSAAMTGGMTPGAPAPAGGMGGPTGMPGMPSAPGGGMVPVRIEGGKVIYRGPNGKEYIGP